MPKQMPQGSRGSGEPPELAELREAATGLLYPSESDAPFEVLRWGGGAGGTTRDQVAARAPKGQDVEEVPVGTFFGELDGVEDAERFRRLRQVLESRLSGLA